MKAFLRSWRWIILVWAVVLAPQVTLVHALSHAPIHQTGKERQSPSSDKVCDSCLALAQLGAALPSQFHWPAQTEARPEATTPAVGFATLRVAHAFRARAPPVSC